MVPPCRQQTCAAALKQAELALVCCDIDGTLISKHSESMTLRTSQLLQGLGETGLPVVLATGRFKASLGQLPRCTGGAP